MKNIFLIPIIAMALVACGSAEDAPTQQLDLLCGEYRVNAAIYNDRAELDITRIRDENHPTWLESYTWLARQIPHIGDTVHVALPARDENKYDNGMGQMEFSLRHDKLTNTAKIWFGSYTQGYEINPTINGKINGWDICTPAITWHGVTEQNGITDMNPDQVRRIQNCIADIRKMRPVINGKKIRLLNSDGKTITRRAEIIDSIIGADDADGRSRYYIYRYQNDDGAIYEYETDACDVAKRLSDFIDKKEK